MDGAKVQNIPLSATFIDFKKAFDSIDRDMMFAILRHYGIPQQIVDAIRTLYDGSSSQVYVQGQLSNKFNITTGILQGDVLAPFLFIIVIDYISNLAAGDTGYLTHTGSSSTNTRPIRAGSTRASHQKERKVSDIAFADDIALLESNLGEAQRQLNAFVERAKTEGLEINIKKTEEMRLNQPYNSRS